MWNNLQFLNSLAIFFQWTAIIMVFIGGMLQLGKFFVENRIKFLKDNENIQNEKLRDERENKLNSQVDSLKINLFSSKKEIIELREKTKFVNPYNQPIHSGNASVLVRIKTTQQLDYKAWDQGGSVEFVNDNHEILILVVISVLANQLVQKLQSFKEILFLILTTEI
jgi:hypothetical protein